MSNRDTVQTTLLNLSDLIGSQTTFEHHSYEEFVALVLENLGNASDLEDAIVVVLEQCTAWIKNKE